ncbi:MAG TPA: hypothetical protein VE619_02500, partial [Nitrososphaeraceae archaeon]|nr:hypothetical protein [Nitrososphaeraceae archaeon]
KLRIQTAGGGRCLAVVACMQYCVGWNDAVSGREHSAENPNQSKCVAVLITKTSPNHTLLKRS